ncbi:MAG: hypothetical protein IJB96_09565 [Lachnospira sp.]|nr:hypothetical protein [Lachnospira sp.]
MKIDGVAVNYDCTSFYLKKQHMCFGCGYILEARRRDVVVNTGTPEAKKYQLSTAETFSHGFSHSNILVTTFFFYCPSCGRSYEVRELINLEREQKRKEKRVRNGLSGFSLTVE